MSDESKKRCDACNCHGQMTVVRSDKVDGFRIGWLCKRCNRAFATTLSRLRSLSATIVYSLLVDPSGGAFKVNGTTFKLTLVQEEDVADESADIGHDTPAEVPAKAAVKKAAKPELSEEEKVADKLRKRQAELDRLYPAKKTQECWREDKGMYNPLADKEDWK